MEETTTGRFWGLTPILLFMLLVIGSGVLTQNFRPCLFWLLLRYQRALRCSSITQHQVYLLLKKSMFFVKEEVIKLSFY
jgi:hypothetical protein